jgi:glutathione peroxidase
VAFLSTDGPLHLQGTFETDEDRIIRIKYYQEYGFGQYPVAVVFDKINVVGKGADPFYKWLCLSLRNPNKIARITLNFEKFLIDEDGKPVRRWGRLEEPAPLPLHRITPRDSACLRSDVWRRWLAPDLIPVCSNRCRYPRRYTAYEIEPDIKALLAGETLPPPTPKFLKAWRDAGVEAERSEYAFKKGLNYYDP